MGLANLMVKRVNLSAHRNTIERRHRKQMQKELVSSATSMGEADIRAYAIVAFRADGTALATWDTGSIMPLWGFAPSIQAVLERDIADSDVEDTWCPALSEISKPKGQA
jgi:transcription elongation factor